MPEKSDTPKLTSTVGPRSVDEPGELRSSFIGAPTSEQPGKLRGTIRNIGDTALISDVSEGGAEPLGTLTEGATIVQRDSGKTFTVANFFEYNGRRTVQLVDSKGDKVTLSPDDLETKLRTEGSAWYW